MTGRPVRIKICGLTRQEDARAAAGAGADYLGAVLAPGTPRVVSPEQAADLARAGGRPLVLVVVDLEIPALEEAARTAGASVIQLHGGEGPREAADIRRRGPWRVWKALRLRAGSEEEVLEGIRPFAGSVDGVVLDAWHPTLPGGTGRRFGWETVAAVRDALDEMGLEVVVAGGLDPENVAVAAELLRPHVLDVSSGVESRTGWKDPGKIRRFVASARGTEGGVGR